MLAPHHVGGSEIWKRDPLGRSVRRKAIATRRRKEMCVELRTVAIAKLRGVLAVEKRIQGRSWTCMERLEIWHGGALNHTTDGGRRLDH